MGFRNSIFSLFDKFEENRIVFFSALGLGLCRSILGWAYTIIRQSSLSLGVEAHYIIGAGEIIGFFVGAFFAFRITLLFVRNELLSFSFFGLVFGIILVTFFNFVQPDFSLAVIFASLGYLFIGSGYSMLFLLWIESLGFLPPRKMVLAFGLAYLVNLLFWLVFQEINWVLAFVFCLTNVLLSIFLLFGAYNTLKLEINLCHQPSLNYSFLPLLIWISTFSFAYGIADSLTNMGYSTYVSKFGMALPEFCCVLCLLLIPDKFDLKSLSIIAFLLMFFGLLGVFFPDDFSLQGQFLLSAANESSVLFALTVACYIAHNSKTTAAAFGGLILMAQSISIRFGVFVGTISLDNPIALYVVVLIMLISVSIALATDGKNSYLVKASDSDAQNNTEEVVLLDIGKEKNLSDRELTVFLAMSKGESYSEISEELFIAPSTVRAHASRIYDKFGVHTREEFNLSLQQEIRLHNLGR